MVHTEVISDFAEAVLDVINGQIPGSCVEERNGRELLITRNGIGVDTRKLATDIAELLDALDARKMK